MTLRESVEQLRALLGEGGGRTFDQARVEILDHLQKLGWAVNPTLKIPHATSPNGHVRLWFKKQAVYFTDLAGEQLSRGSDPPATRHDFGDARTISYSLDTRKLDPEQFMALIQKQFEGSL